MIVIDLSVLAPFVLRTNTFRLAAKVSDHDPLWIMPREWRLELLNELGELVRGGYTSTLEAHTRLLAAEMLIRESHELIDDINILSSIVDSRLNALESVYVLTARRLGTKLITGKTNILAMCPDVAISLETFGAN